MSGFNSTKETTQESKQRKRPKMSEYSQLFRVMRQKQRNMLGLAAKRASCGYVPALAKANEILIKIN